MEQPARRSARIKKKPRFKFDSYDDDDDTSDFISEDSEHEEPEENDSDAFQEQEKAKEVLKRRKTKHDAAYKENLNDNAPSGSSSAVIRRVRGRKGFLNFMNDMPLDIIYEIFKQLEPIDLLHLSWACKSLHSILMGRQARFLWKKALAAVCSYRASGPPPCPSDLNYAQFTRFLFAKQCMVCQKAIAAYFSWGLRFKSCWNCLQTDHFIHDSIAPRYRFYFVRHGIWAKGKLFFLKSTILKEQGLVGNPKLIQAHICEYQIRDREKLEYETWRKSLAACRKGILDDLRKERRELILEKLAHLGWSKTDILKYTGSNTFDHFGDIPTFNKSTKLTPGEWEKIRPVILSALEQRKKAWEETLIQSNCWFISYLVNRWTPKSNSDFCFKAHASEFYIHEPFKSCILDVNRKEVINLNAASAARLESINTKCLQKRNEKLFSLLPDDLKERSRGMDNPYKILQLATIWFQDVKRATSDPIKLMDYPTVLMDAKKSNGTSRKNDPDSVKQLARVIEHRPWELDSARFAFDHRSHELAQELVTACGHDPDTATIKTMSSVNARISCKLCRKRKFTWSSAVIHAFMIHNECPIWGGAFRVVLED